MFDTKASFTHLSVCLLSLKFISEDAQLKWNVASGIDQSGGVFLLYLSYSWTSDIPAYAQQNKITIRLHLVYIYLSLLLIVSGRLPHYAFARELFTKVLLKKMVLLSRWKANSKLSLTILKLRNSTSGILAVMHSSQKPEEMYTYLGHLPANKYTYKSMSCSESGLLSGICRLNLDGACQGN